MATANLENQLHSAQKNLLFLQREHASTLKGLHAEIRRLQQHCTGARARASRGRGGRPVEQDLTPGQLHAWLAQQASGGGGGCSLLSAVGDLSSQRPHAWHALFSA